MTDTTLASLLIPPCGDQLVDLTTPAEALDELKAKAVGLPSVQLSERALCDLELLAVGGFSPLDRFMGQADYLSVLNQMRLTSGALFSIPVTLPVDPGPEIRLDREIALRDARNEILAVMMIEEIYEWDRAEAARKIFGTEDSRHPLVGEMHQWGRINIAGALRVLQLPRHYDFRDIRLTPAETRERLERYGRRNVVAFQTRNPLHRAHEEMTKRAVSETNGVLLLHPVVGLTKAGDIDHYSRVRTYRVLAKRYYEPDRILLNLLPLAMRMAGPREALWHAQIRRNYGANHLIVGRDHASPGLDSTGRPFYSPYAAQEIVEQHAAELGVRPVTFQEFVYLPEEKVYEESHQVTASQRTLKISGTQVREDYLNRGRNLPAWFTRCEVAKILSENYPPRHKQGFCIWFTGLSGAGKSTIAEILTVILLEHGRQATVLDGDVVRTHLSKGLGFSREDRDTNVRRIGFVAAEIARHCGIAVCAAVSPYRATRNDVRNMVGAERFVEVYVNTPLEVCERRDVKGMYARARRGELKGFTGIDDAYEPPDNPELVIETESATPEESARQILDYLLERGLVRSLDASRNPRRQPLHIQPKHDNSFYAPTAYAPPQPVS